MLHENTLKTAFLAMMYVAREEGETLPLEYFKYLELEDEINEESDLNLTDMIDNMENIYKLIKKGS